MSDSWLVQNGSDSHLLGMLKDLSGNDTFAKQPIDFSGDGDMYHQAAVAANIDGMSLKSGVSTGMGLYDVPTLTTLNQGLDNNCPTSRGPSRRSSANLHQLVGFNYGLPDSNQLPSEYQLDLQEQKGSKENSASNLRSIDDLYAKIIPNTKELPPTLKTFKHCFNNRMKITDNIKRYNGDEVEYLASTSQVSRKSSVIASSSPRATSIAFVTPCLPITTINQAIAKQKTKSCNQSVSVRDGSRCMVKKSITPKKWNGACSEGQGLRGETKCSILISTSAGRQAN